MDGVSVNKGESIGYLAKTYNKSKQFFRNTDGSPVDPEKGVPPPRPLSQPSINQASRFPATQTLHTDQENPLPSGMSGWRKRLSKGTSRLKIYS